MAKLKYKTISKRTVEALRVEKDTVFWDRELTGFGVRVYPSGGRVYVVQARGPDGPKRITLGRHGVITADQARRRAALIIARVKAGEAPVPEPMAAKPEGGPTVAELAARYLKEHVVLRFSGRTTTPDTTITPGRTSPYARTRRFHVLPCGTTPSQGMNTSVGCAMNTGG